MTARCTRHGGTCGNIRDIALTLSRDGERTFSTPARVEDKWVLDGCRQALCIGVQAASILCGHARRRTDGGQQTLALFYSASDDGLRFTAPAATAGLRSCQMAIDAADGSLLVVWDELKDGAKRAVAAQAFPMRPARWRSFAKRWRPSSAYPVVANCQRVRARLDG